MPKNLRPFPTRNDVLTATFSEIHDIFTTHAVTLKTLFAALYPEGHPLHNSLLKSLSVLDDFTTKDPAEKYGSLLNAELASSFDYGTSSSAGPILIIHMSVDINGTRRSVGNLEFNGSDLAHPVLRSHLFALFYHLVPNF